MGTISFLKERLLHYPGSKIYILLPYDTFLFYSSLIENLDERDRNLLSPENGGLVFILNQVISSGEQVLESLEKDPVKDNEEEIIQKKIKKEPISERLRLENKLF